VPPGTPSNGCRDAQGNTQEAILTNFTLKTKSVTKKKSKKNKKKRQLITTPKKCPSGGWTFKADIKYADGTAQAIEEKSPCRK
jgi:hypothetical protein